MKKLINILIIALCLMLPLSAAAKDNNESAPKLTSISFNNAVINEEFSKDVFEYTVTLDDPTVTPTLKSYTLSSEANLFVTYELDEGKHQTGITVTLEYENGSLFYTFVYANADEKKASSNNLLADLSCRLGEVYPKINDSQTSYKLYIPSDLTEINLIATTKDTGAFCDIPKSIRLGIDQEPELSVTVTASNGETRVYTLAVKRLKKSSAEVQKEMESPDFISLVEGELFWQKPSFSIAIAGVIGAAALMIIFIKIAKRLTVKIEDENETSFFADEE